MAILVDIADRLYDYTDEEKAAEAIAEFQENEGLSDDQILAVWRDGDHPLHLRLEKVIFDAVDANGSVKRARESIPNGITLALDA